MLARARGIWTVLLLAVCLPPAAWGQARWVSIETNQPDAVVYVDSTWMGSAGQRVFELPVGASEISVVPPSVDTWVIPAITFRATGTPVDTLRLNADFPYYYRVESIPSGATVYYEGSEGRIELGETPVDYVSARPLEDELVIDLDGYLIRRVDPGRSLWNRHLVLLESSVPTANSHSDLSISRVHRSHWIDYAAVGVAVAGGILAVHYKTKADNRYDAYNETRSPRLKSEVQRLDVYSGVALGAMQVGLGVLAIRLVF